MGMKWREYDHLKGYKVFAWIMVLASIIMIFALSSQTAVESDGTSKWVTKMILKAAEQLGLVESSTSENAHRIALMNQQLRQLAHTFVYFVFSFFLFKALSRSGTCLPASLVLTLLLSCILAGLDEWHQAYVPGRGKEIKDFVSDALGILLAVMLCLSGQFAGKMANKKAS